MDGSAFDALQRRVVEWRESQAEGTSRCVLALLSCLYLKWLRNEPGGRLLEPWARRSSALRRSRGSAWRAYPLLSPIELRLVRTCVNMDDCIEESSWSAFAVVLVFGASIASPREAVVVDLTGIKRADLNDGIDSSNGLESPAMSKAKIARLCSQKLLRALIADGAHEHTRFVLHAHLKRFRSQPLSM